jgi:hypothetical protein
VKFLKTEKEGFIGWFSDQSIPPEGGGGGDRKKTEKQKPGREPQ